MTARTIGADVLLGLATVIVLGSSVGILVMRDVYQKLHYVTPAAVMAPLAVALAVLVEAGWSINTMQTWLTLAFVIVSAPYLTHATARAARIRDAGDWRAVAGDRRPATDDRRPATDDGGAPGERR